MPRLTVLSYAFPDIDAGSRAVISRHVDGNPSELRQPTFVLGTCLRVEVAWAGGHELIQEILDDLFLTDLLPKPSAARTDEDAFHYLCRVAAGLESPAVGEPEVLTQFRQALRTLDEAAPRSTLTSVLEAAVGVARGARRRLKSPAQESLAAAAARAVRGASPIALLGNGAMARSVAELLEGSDLSVYARRSGAVGGHQTRPWNALASELGAFPAVVSTVPGGESDFDSLIGSGVPSVLVDLGMPPAFGPTIAARVPRYLGIDELAAEIVPLPQHDAAEAAAEGAGTAWARLVASERGGSIIRALLARAEEAVDEEVSRFAHRVQQADDPEAVLRQVAHNVARRVLHPPISYVGATPLDKSDLDLMAEAFGIENE